MMKTIIIICSFFCFFLYGNSIAAQETKENKVSKDEFENLLNYWTCKYTEAYIEERKDTHSNDYKKYKEYFQSKLQDSTIEKPLSFGILSNLMKDNNWPTTEKTLTSVYYNSRKDKFKVDLTVNGAIDILKLTKFSDFKALNETTRKLTEATQKYFKDKDKEQDKDKDKDKEQKQNDVTPNNASPDTELSYTTLIIFALLLTVIVLGFRVKTWHNKNYVKKTDKVAKLEQKIKEQETIISKQKEDILRFKKDNDKLEQDKQDLNIRYQKKYAEFDNMLSKQSVVSHLKKDEIKREEVSMENSSILYANSINNGEFYNVTAQPNDFSIYLLERINGGDTAIFSVYPNAEKRVVARTGNLDGCEIGIASGGTRLQIIAKGKARKHGDKWVIEQKLKVKIV